MLLVRDGKPATVIAEADEGYEFVKWNVAMVNGSRLTPATNFNQVKAWTTLTAEEQLYQETLEIGIRSFDVCLTPTFDVVANAILITVDHSNSAEGTVTPVDTAPIEVKANRQPLNLTAVPAEGWCKQIPLLLTSGTLAIGSSFRRFQDECGLCGNPRVMESIAVSPFNYADNCRLFFPRYSVRLNSERYYDEIAAEILQLLRAANGHALVLFTSYADLSAVNERLATAKVPIFSLRRNRPQILRQFKSTPGAVLLATGAAWEGMDFPGDCVSLLIIPRLPFAFPDAIHEHEKQNYPTLQDFIRSVIVPEMQIKLKQGFGRAIRTETDTCVVAILDERCSARGRYRQDVLDALPEMPILTEVSAVRQFLCAVKPQSYFEAAA